ncbi:MAG: hypothetical protein L0Z62_15950 [Gemmataceae bacterium]|nr:hypothetical protein [Gemmataceae bacterium]
MRKLADWLEGSGLEEPPGLDFLEPELRFGFPDGDRSKLRIYFDWGLRPKWAPVERVAEFFIEFPVTEKVLQQAAESLRAQLKRNTRGKRK